MGGACAVLACALWMVSGGHIPALGSNIARQSARILNAEAGDSRSAPGAVSNPGAAPLQRTTVEYDLANLSVEQRARIERALEVLSRVEHDAKNRGDRDLLAQVESERGRLVKATTGVDEQALQKGTQ